MFSIIGIIGSGCSLTDRIGLAVFTRRRTVKIQQMTKYILGGVIAVGLTFFCASSNAQAKEKKMNEALTINGDGAQRNPDIHWPKDSTRKTLTSMPTTRLW